jgi:hypothetical protein
MSVKRNVKYPEVGASVTMAWAFGEKRLHDMDGRWMSVKRGGIGVERHTTLVGQQLPVAEGGRVAQDRTREAT